MMFSPLEQFEIFPVVSFFGELNLINVFIPVIIFIFFYLLVLKLLLNKFFLVSGSWQSFFEEIYCFVKKIVETNIGTKGLVYLPFMLTIFVFILFHNFVSLTPFSYALSTYVFVVLFFSFSIISFVFMTGVIENGFRFFRLFVPHSSFFMLLLLVPIELFSYIIRNFSLALRLSANIMSGHALVHIIIGFFVLAAFYGYIFAFFSGVVIYMVLLLEFGVSFLQAFVLVTLVCIYMQESLEGGEH